MSTKIKHIIVAVQWVMVLIVSFLAVWLRIPSGDSDIGDALVFIIANMFGFFIIFLPFILLNFVVSVFIYKGKGLFSQKKL